MSGNLYNMKSFLPLVQITKQENVDKQLSRC